MKKIISLSFVITLCALQSCSSTRNMQEFYTKYDSKARVIPLPSFALKLAGKMGGVDLFNYIKSAKVFIVNNVGENKQNRVIRDLASSVKGENYESLVKLKSRNNNLNVAIKENAGRIEKMILGVNGLNRVLVLDSNLNVSKAELEKAIDKINVEDIQELVGILK